MANGNYTVLYSTANSVYKICRIFWGSDGSFYVTAPYHPAQKLFLCKATVNYALSEMNIPFGQLFDAALVDDDKRIKLSHHPDGLVQFSGQGIVSGRDTDGNVKGIGVMSWPLLNPTLGPAFGLAIRKLETFQLADDIPHENCWFRQDELTTIPNANILTLEGYYFPPLWRRFIRTGVDGAKTISITHPAKAVLPLKVILPPERCAIPGFIGVEMYSVFVQVSEDDFFCMSGPTGNLRRNEKGEILGDGVYCMYPRLDRPARVLDLSLYHMTSIADDPGGRGDKTQS